MVFCNGLETSFLARGGADAPFKMAVLSAGSDFDRGMIKDWSLLI